MTDYKEPALSILVLDFNKPVAARACLESIKRHVRFPVKVIYLHNGISSYPRDFYEEGLIDTLIQTRKNEGLGIGTRNLVATCFSPHFMMLQNDQVIARDFTEQEFESLCEAIDVKTEDDKTIASVSLAGAVCGKGVYSERCHIMQTSFYKKLETELPLSPGGAGPFHNQVWREGQIQKVYEHNRFVHYTEWPPLVTDRGVTTVRDNGGGRVEMRTDTKAVTWLTPPIRKDVFPEHTEEEWQIAFGGKWPAGKIPQLYLERNQSFNCWGDATQ